MGGRSAKRSVHVAVLLGLQHSTAQHGTAQHSTAQNSACACVAQHSLLMALDHKWRPCSQNMIALTGRWQGAGERGQAGVCIHGLNSWRHAGGRRLGRSTFRVAVQQWQLLCIGASSVAC